jgi:hypothetical protein
VRTAARFKQTIMPYHELCPKLYHLISLNGFTWNFCGLSLPASNWFYEGTPHITKNETLIYCTFGEASTPSLIIWFLISYSYLFCVSTHLQHWAYFLVSSLLPNIQVHTNIIIIRQFGKKTVFLCEFHFLHYIHPAWIL